MTSAGPPLDVLVIGAGISGLTAAFRLAWGGLRVAVIEAAERVGGAIETRTEGAWRFEMGPNTVVEDPAIAALVRDAGLEGEKLLASPAAKRRYIYKAGRLVPLPGGPGAFLATPLFPLGAKLRLLKEPWIRRSAETEESVAAFVRRRLGPAFLDNAAGPFVSGVWAGDPERLAVRWAMPGIAALEREHGSLLRGALAKRKVARKEGRSGRRGPLLSFRDGLEALPRALAAAVGDVRTGIACTGLAPASDGGFRAETSAGPILARRVVLAVPADVAARLLEELTAGASRVLAEVPYAPVAVVAAGYRRADVAHPLDGFGFLAPRGEGLRLLGCLFPSEIFPGRAPEGHVVLSAFLGGRTDPEIATWDDDRLLPLVDAELARTLGVRGEPFSRVVRRWPRAIPQYEIGHGRFVEAAHEIEARWLGLHFGANFLGGVSLPDCVANATALAEKILGERPAAPR